MSYTTVSELSVDEFKNLIREVVEQTIADMITDPDEGLDLRDNVKDILRASINSFQFEELETLPAEQVAANLGLEW